MIVRLLLFISALLTATSIVLATINILDESRLDSFAGVIAYSCLWALPPGILFMKQLQEARRNTLLDLCLNLFRTLMLFFIALNYMHYAFNGDTATKFGAQALHLFLVPIILIVIVFIAEGLAYSVLREHKG